MHLIAKIDQENLPIVHWEIMNPIEMIKSNFYLLPKKVNFQN